VPLHERGTGVSLRPASDFRIDRIGSALRGENPTVLARMPGGFACMGDTQWLPGYCVLLSDDPDVGRLSDLPRQKRLAFLESMSDLGEAVERACRAADPAFRRVNLEILGNTDAYLHTHVWPRYDWEPADRIGGPVWRYPKSNWTAAESQLGPQHQTLRDALVHCLASPSG